jgi:hypothetical protein
VAGGCGRVPCMKTSRAEKDHAKVVRLRELAGRPEAQAAYALELLPTERNSEVARTALAALEDTRNEAARPVLVERYEHFQARWSKLDQGGYVRTAIL